MNIRALKIFLAVVDNQTMNAASRKLNLSQPTISQTICEMEHYYGVKLFDRLSRHLYLTPVGEQLLPYARYIVSSFDDMELFLKNSSANPTLRIGSTDVFSTYYLSGILFQMKKTHPDFTINITVTNTPTIESKLLNSELDMGIVEGIISHPDIITEHLTSDQISLICGRTHPFYGKTIHFQDLDGCDLISREDTSFLRKRFQSIAQERGISYHELWKCNASEAIKSAVVAGLGIGIISTVMIEKELADGSLYAIPILDFDFKREIYLVWHKNKFLSQGLKLFVQTCRQYVAQKPAT